MRFLDGRENFLLDDLFNNQGNRNDQIGLYRGESICYDFGDGVRDKKWMWVPLTNW